MMHLRSGQAKQVLEMEISLFQIGWTLKFNGLTSMMCEWSPPPDPLPLSHGAGEDGFESKCQFKPLCCSFSICPPLSKLEDSSQIDQGSTCSGPLTCCYQPGHP